MTMISSVEDFLRVDDLLQEQCAELKQLEEELKGAQQLALARLQASLPALDAMRAAAEGLAQSTGGTASRVEADVAELRATAARRQGLRRVVAYLRAAGEVDALLRRSREALAAGLGGEALALAGRAVEALAVFPPPPAVPAAPPCLQNPPAESSPDEEHHSPTSLAKYFNPALFLGSRPGAVPQAESSPPSPSTARDERVEESGCSALARQSRKQCAAFLQAAVQRFAADFRLQLGAARYPRQGADAGDAAAEDLAVADLKRGWQLLLAAHRLAEGLSAPGPALEAVFTDPVRLRFRYHFSGAKETNRRDRPEWLFQFMERLLAANLPLLSHFSHAVDISHGTLLESGILPKVIQGCVQILHERLQPELAALQRQGDEALFSHYVNEMAAFDRLLTARFGYPANTLTGSLKQRRRFCLDTVTEDPRLWRYWLEIDRRFAEQRLASTLDSSECWLPQYGSLAEIDDVKISKGAQTTSSLLMALNSKYSAITAVEVLDAFITSIHRTIIHGLLQSIKDTAACDLPPLGVDLAGAPAARWRVYCSALSSACAMATVLTTWSDLPMFTDLQCALQAASTEPVTEPLGEAAGPPGRYFADLVTEFAACGDAMAQRLVGALAATFCPPVAKGYAAALLDTMRALHDPTGRLSVEEITGLVCTVSPVIHTAALDLAAHLSFLAAHVTSDRFGMLWRGLAAELDAFLFRHLSTHPALQRLSYAQARQFRVDVEGLALLLFGPFSRHPKAHLGTCQQAAAVLTLHPVERQEVLRCLQEEDPAARAEGRAQLQTRGVTGLTEDQLRGLLRAVH